MNSQQNETQTTTLGNDPLELTADMIIGNSVDDIYIREQALRAIAQINQEQGFGIKELLEEANMIVAWLKTGEIK